MTYYPYQAFSYISMLQFTNFKNKLVLILYDNDDLVVSKRQKRLTEHFFYFFS